MRITVEVKTELVVEFDENSEEFKALHESCNKFTSPSGYEQFAQHICSHVARYGVSGEIEGVGRVRINGEKQKENFGKRKNREEIDCPINVIGDFDLNDKCDFETYTLD